MGITEIYTVTTVIIRFKQKLKNVSTKLTIISRKVQALLINWNTTKTEAKYHQMATELII